METRFRAFLDYGLPSRRRHPGVLQGALGQGQPLAQEGNLALQTAEPDRTPDGNRIRAIAHAKERHVACLQ